MGEYLLGIDAGNTVIKAVIFDRRGNEIAMAAEEGHSHVPKPGHVERGLGELWSHAKVVIRACIERARALGYASLTLWTNDILAAARKIYQAEGFQLVAENRHHSFGKDLVGQTWTLDLERAC